MSFSFFEVLVSLCACLFSIILHINLDVLSLIWVIL